MAQSLYMGRESTMSELFDSMKRVWFVLCCLHLSVCLFVGRIPFCLEESLELLAGAKEGRE